MRYKNYQKISIVSKIHIFYKIIHLPFQKSGHLELEPCLVQFVQWLIWISDLLGDLLAGLPRHLAAVLTRYLRALLARHLAGNVDALLARHLVTHLARDLAALLPLHLVALLPRHLHTFRFTSLDPETEKSFKRLVPDSTADVQWRQFLLIACF